MNVAVEALRSLPEVATGSLVAAIWQGTLLAGAAALGLRLLPKTPAAVRFAIWFSVFLLMAALPLAGIWGHGAASTGNHTAWLTLSARWSFAILGLWVGTSLVRAITLVIAAFRVHALWQRATPVNIIQPEGLVRRAQVCTSDEIDRPSVIGFFSPRILIPRWLLAKLTPDELAQIVLHEAGHLRRADDWLNLLQKLALVVFPLNPALAWVERRLCFERELACDERVLHAYAARPDASTAYATCLTNLAEHRMSRRAMTLVMSALGRESELGQRIMRILGRSEKMSPVHARVVFGGAVIALAAAATGFAHCPQLIGFTGIAPQVAASAHPSASAALKLIPGFDIQQVVFHSETPKPRAKTSKTQPKRPVMQHTTQASNTQWVVMTSMTSWTNGSGTHVVMTSYESSAPTATARPASSRPTPQPKAVEVSAPQQDDALPRGQQVYPYAAVPVRGGWLIIKL